MDRDRASLREDWTERFKMALRKPDQVWFVAEVDGVVVGAIFTGHESGLGHLGMAILEGHRGRGIGRALVASSLDWAAKQRCHKVVLEVWPHNARARALYSSAGFEDEGYLKRHYRRRSGDLWDAVAMGLVLDQSSQGRPATDA